MGATLLFRLIITTVSPWLKRISTSPRILMFCSSLQLLFAVYLPPFAKLQLVSL